MSLFLIDTSAWVDFFRGERAARKQVDPVLAQRRAAICGPVYAEVLSGATQRAAYDRLGLLFRAFTWLDASRESWRRVAELRFQLARQGIQASLTDLLIAVIASDASATLLTRDRDYLQIARVLPLELVVF